MNGRGRGPGGLGPLMMDLAGTGLDGEDREIASHPAIGGVVLFDRNFEDLGQLADLTSALHRLRSPPLLIAVDHEGGRVQRFRNGFTRLPAARRIGARFARDPEIARSLARAAGLVAAAELRRAGIDLAFAPVVDLSRGNEETIGERAFHADPAPVIDLAGGWLEGAGRAGFSGVGKHFPGHGTARGDTHLVEVVDERPLARMRESDLAPFAALAGSLGGVMTSHVRFPAVDAQAAVTFSETWIRGVLRRDLGFAGIVFSDDLSMEAARGERGAEEARVAAALAAGCDAALVMNDRAALVRVLDGWRPDEVPATRDLGVLRPDGRASVPAHRYHEAAELLRRHLGPEPEPAPPPHRGG
ncbi:MAG: beta-N-acetylhexosaminidase [Immundisolibacterales bacterium]|nr:beta-N-acetylhexosaminidase [Immundisolibacterales bacterium]